MPTILLADDSITIQKIVNLTFSGEGIDVVTVGNGEAALKKIYELRPSLVLADIFMPGKNGYEVCDYVKNEPALSSTPVILLVGAFEPFDSNEAARVKADGHLTKPFEIKVLISAVNSLISAAGEQKDASERTPDPPAPQIDDSGIADELTLGTIAPLPDMPATPQVDEVEMPMEMPPFETASVDLAVAPVALGVDTEEVELLSSAAFAPDATLDTESLATPSAKSKPPEPVASPVIEESDPLGLLAGDVGLGPGGGGEIAMDARSMVVDIWEPRQKIEAGSSTEDEAPAVLPADTGDPELATPVPSVDEADPVPVLNPDRTTIEPPFEPLVSQVVTDMEAGMFDAPIPVPTAVSDELIERIANRVVEKLSREVIERIAWEVVPDLAELMIREQVEAQLKESHQS